MSVVDLVREGKLVDDRSALIGKFCRKEFTSEV